MSELGDRQAKATENRRRALIREYNERNWQHQQEVSDKANEQEELKALRYNVTPRLMRPEDVPDLPRPAELEAFDLQRVRRGQTRTTATAGERKALKAAGILVLLFVPLAIAVTILATWPNLLSVVLLLAVLVAEAWFLLRYLAKGVAAKGAKAADRKARLRASAQRV